ASAVVGCIVAVCGPVAFVGLIVPHLCRLMVGSDHRVLVPAVFLLGSVFLGVCFTAARILLYPTILPVGILTSLMGGPFFLWFLLRSGK
ncbi:MAG: iron chelate uptake ABC transporter family permease subunit, partial [Thermoguttaceae bacterium]|nr:iron chelate uptake ABC transporter family permease subunit [Thermoguttaceae bacterium]